VQRTTQPCSSEGPNPDNRLFFAHASFFTEDAVASYQTFIGALFVTFVGPGAPPRLRTARISHDGDRRVAYPGEWPAPWDDVFTDETERTDVAVVRSTYRALLDRLAAEVGVEPRRREQVR
jgi:hypothetical protein